jgi:hypothetical protein
MKGNRYLNAGMPKIKTKEQYEKLLNLIRNKPKDSDEDLEPSDYTIRPWLFEK